MRLRSFSIEGVAKKMIKSMIAEKKSKTNMSKNRTAKQ